MGDNTTASGEAQAITECKISFAYIVSISPMMSINVSRQSKIKVVLCFTYLLLIIFYHHIDKYLNGAVFVILTLLIPISFITISVYSVKGIIKSIRHRKKLPIGSFISTVVCVLTLCYSIFSPYRLDSESLESDVEFRACYEGTQNQATIKFRKDKSFELHSTGGFFANTWYTGQWNKNGDIIYLKYDNKKSESLGNVLLIKDGYLHNIGKSTKGLKGNIPMFYLGYCRHEN